mgnify:CR=1 FL=1
MPRSVKKGPFIDDHLALKVEAAAEETGRRAIKTWSRRSVIIPDFVGSNIMVHNGNKGSPVYITEHMVVHKQCEFSPTRTFRGHAADLQIARGLVEQVR